MPITVPSTEVQKDFDLWHDKAMSEPVQVTKHGRETAYLVSAEIFHELWRSYRRRVEVRDLSDNEMAMIAEADVPDEFAYEIEDLQASVEHESGETLKP